MRLTKYLNDTKELVRLTKYLNFTSLDWLKKAVNLQEAQKQAGKARTPKHRDWGKARVYNNTRCSKKLWSYKNMQRTDAEFQCDATPECKGLMWCKPTSGG